MGIVNPQTELRLPNLYGIQSSSFGVHAIVSGGAAGLTKPVSPNAFAQLASDDTLVIKSSDASDTTQYAMVIGVDDTDSMKTVVVKLNGTNNVSISATFRYVEQVFLNAAAAGTVSLEDASTSTTICSVSAGELSTAIAHKFAAEVREDTLNRRGHIPVFLNYWDVMLQSSTENVHAQVRVYDDMSSARDLSSGYVVRGSVKTVTANGHHGFQQQTLNAIRVPQGGYVAIVAEDVGANNADFSVTLEGFNGA